jgi:hypothetical protein
VYASDAFAEKVEPEILPRENALGASAKQRNNIRVIEGLRKNDRLCVMVSLWKSLENADSAVEVIYR